MSTPFNEHWLEMGACVPVDIETTAILLKEIKQLRHDARLERQWADLSKEECWDIFVAHKNKPFSILVAVQAKLKEKNT